MNRWFHLLRYPLAILGGLAYSAWLLYEYLVFRVIELGLFSPGRREWLIFVVPVVVLTACIVLVRSGRRNRIISLLVLGALAVVVPAAYAALPRRDKVDRWENALERYVKGKYAGTIEEYQTTHGPIDTCDYLLAYVKTTGGERWVWYHGPTGRVLQTMTAEELLNRLRPAFPPSASVTGVQGRHFDGDIVIEYEYEGHPTTTMTKIMNECALKSGPLHFQLGMQVGEGPAIDLRDH